jgi:hypothetical protein
MKIYKIHFGYAFAISLFLLINSHTAIRQFLDPTYHIARSRFMPRALFWYFVVFCWYMVLKTAYKVEITEDGTITTTSILKKHILTANDIISVKESSFFVYIFTKQGKISVSTLIDGIPNIKEIFNAHSEADSGEIKGIQRARGASKVIKIIAVLILVIYAIYVEYMQWTVYR